MCIRRHNWKICEFDRMPRACPELVQMIPCLKTGNHGLKPLLKEGKIGLDDLRSE
jgi:hypothetical protein